MISEKKKYNQTKRCDRHRTYPEPNPPPPSSLCACSTPPLSPDPHRFPAPLPSPTSFPWDVANSARSDLREGNAIKTGLHTVHMNPESTYYRVLSTPGAPSPRETGHPSRKGRGSSLGRGKGEGNGWNFKHAERRSRDEGRREGGGGGGTRGGGRGDQATLEAQLTQGRP